MNRYQTRGTKPLILLYVMIHPPLTGVKSELWYKVEDIIGKLTPLPDSVDGIIDIGLGSTSPEYSYFIRVPEQTINGVTYMSVDSNFFNLLTDTYIDITMIPKGGGNGGGNGGAPKLDAALITKSFFPIVVGVYLVTR